jgi:hypothetical protein
MSIIMNSGGGADSWGSVVRYGGGGSGIVIIKYKYK